MATANAATTEPSIAHPEYVPTVTRGQMSLTPLEQHMLQQNAPMQDFAIAPLVGVSASQAILVVRVNVQSARTTVQDMAGVYSPPRSPRPANSWDADKIFGCVCDSSWPVGYGSGDQFVSEWFGPDCSLRRCPSGFDRGNAVESNALNCFNVSIPNSGSRTRAGQGALCYIECSRQGLCDYKTGACEYYEGYEPPKQNDTVVIEEDDTTIYLRNLERGLEELRRRSGGS
eukprot:gene39161-47650_t